MAFGFKNRLEFGKVLYLFDEKLIDLCYFMDLFDRETAFESFKNGEQTPVGQVEKPFFDRPFVDRRKGQRIGGDLSAADRLHQRRLKGRSDAHDFARRFHLGPELS